MFVNLFGSPFWLFKIAVSLSASFNEAMSRNISSKKKSKILFIRLRLCVDAINSCIGRECSYFINNCNKSRIYIREAKLFFNMYRAFASKVNDSLIDKNILYKAYSLTKNGKIIYHPTVDRDYEEGSSNGYLFSHWPISGQESMIVKNDINGDEHCMIYNNIQSEEMIGAVPLKGLNQSNHSIESLLNIASVVRYKENSQIFVQSEKGYHVLNNSYRNIKDNELKEINFSTNKIKSINKERNGLAMQSQSEEDMLNNSLNQISNANLENKRFENFRYRIDSSIIPKDKWFQKLKTVDQIHELAIRNHLLNQYTLTDEEVLKIFNSRASSFDSNNLDSDD